jgi:SAM-dependent methyltransferase
MDSPPNGTHADARRSIKHPDQEKMNPITANPITDEAWLNANLNPSAGRAELGISIPDLPPDDIQLRFTGRSGRANFEHIFGFYKLILKNMPREQLGRLRLLDFGGGWGRILRLFLREYPAEQLALFDCLTVAVESAQSLNPPFSVTQNQVLPPLPLEKECTDCCYAFSVFSHLSEAASTSWITNLCEVLVPGGKLIFTTRGRGHIDYLRHLHTTPGTLEGVPALLPKPDDIERRYLSGEFQFYSAAGGGELTGDFYGETWITERWIKEHHQELGFRSYEFLPELGVMDQCIIILTK